MNPEEITQELANKRDPFTFSLSDGKSFAIQHPDYILISPNREHVIFYPENGGHRLVDTGQITSIEFLKQKEGGQ